MVDEIKSDPKWILPPGLRMSFDQFIKLYDTAFKNPPKRRRPLLIHGGPGVGKSLFTYAFETLFRRDCPGTLRDSDVKRVNVSALAETLFESEIFGHKKGAFTGATADKKGFLENTKLLILEEIGELSKKTQAKLLTFMEDGIYYRVGDTTPGRAADDIQIIATTNAPLDVDHFRQDFLDRLYRFPVPALHTRRFDLLYILASEYRDFFCNLSPGETLLTLCYNWPGNMREIEKFAVMRHPGYCQKNFWEPASRLEKTLSLLHEMGIYDTDENEKKVESFFYRGHLTLNYFNNYPMEERQAGKRSHEMLNKDIAFKNINIVRKPLKGFTAIEAIEVNEELRRTWLFFLLYLMILHIKQIADVDLYDVDAMFKDGNDYVDIYKHNFDRIFSHLPPSDRQYAKIVWKWVQKAEKYGIQEHFNISKIQHIPPKHPSKQSTPDFINTTETEILKQYYCELLSRTDGNIAEVARRSGVNRKTLDNKLISLGIHPTRKK